MTYSNVVLVVIDGLRPDAISPEVMPGLHQLGHHFWRARSAVTIRPSITVAALTSLATGVGPDTHTLIRPGLGSLPALRNIRPLPRELQRMGIETTVVMGELSGSGRLIASTLLRLAGIQRLVAPPGRASRVVAEALGELDPGLRRFTIVYLDGADRAGHRSGWMSPSYLEAAWEIDLALAPLFSAALEESSLLLVTADHGGGGVDPCDHDLPHPDNDTIPLIVAGQRVRRGGGSARRASLLDIPPTILRAMGGEAPSGYEGRVLVEALGEPAMRVGSTPTSEVTL